MQQVIIKERLLIAKHFGKKLTAKKGEVRKEGFSLLRANLFVYINSLHISMSSVKLSLLEMCGITFSQKNLNRNQCTNPEHQAYDGYHPFFNNNNVCRQYFKKIVDDTSESSERRVEVIKYQNILSRVTCNNSHKNTMFHTTGLPNATCWDLQENEWSVRLMHCMLMYLPDHVHPRCTIEEGSTFEDLQSVYSRSQSCGKMFLFQGAPDIIVTTRRRPTIAKLLRSQCGQQLDCEQNLDPQDTEQSGQQFSYSEQSLLDPQDIEEEEDGIISLSESLCSGVMSEESSVDVDKMDDDDDSDSEDDTSIEVCKAPVPVHDLTRLPEKLGQ